MTPSRLSFAVEAQPTRCQGGESRPIHMPIFFYVAVQTVPFRKKNNAHSHRVRLRITVCELEDRRFLLQNLFSISAQELAELLVDVD